MVVTGVEGNDCVDELLTGIVIAVIDDDDDGVIDDDEPVSDCVEGGGGYAEKGYDGAIEDGVWY